MQISQWEKIIIMYISKDLYPESIMVSYVALRKRQQCSRNMGKTLNELFKKKISKCLINIRKGAQFF